MPLDAHLRRWTSRLTDLTRRNRLAFFRPSKTGTLELIVEASNLYSAFLRDRTIALGEKEVKLEEGADLRRRLRALAAKAREYEEERGVDALFVAFGIVEWPSDDADRPYAAPLLLVPARLEERARGRFVLERGGDAVVNPVLVLALKEREGVDLSAVPFLSDVDADADGAVTLEDEYALAERAIGRAKLRRESHLGIFSYHKMVMVQDIERHRDAIAASPILAALTGDTAAMAALRTEPLDPRTLDTLPAASQFHILDADSSQTAVIERAKRGASLVVQGPPGTGKSQTIANLLAELVGAGKRVLFVAEKRAALEVVLDRLSKAGLRHLCFDLHSSHIKKRDVAARLKESLERLNETPPVHEATIVLHELERARATLTGYVRALHAPQPPLDRSVYEMRAALLESTTPMEVRLRGTALLSFDTAKRDEALAALDGLGRTETDRESVWGRTTLVDPEPGRALRDCAVDVLHGALPEVRRMPHAAELGLRPPASFKGVESLLRILDVLAEGVAVPEAWLTSIDDAKALVRDFTEFLTKLRKDRDRLLVGYAPSVFDDPELAGLAERFRTRGTSWFTWLFSSAARADRRAMLKHRNAPANLATLRDESARAVGVAERMRQAAGRFDGMKTDLDALRAQVDWAERFVKMTGGLKVPATPRPGRTDHHTAATKTLRALLADLAAALPGDWVGMKFDDLEPALRRLIDELPMLTDILAARRFRARLDAVGLGAVAEELRRRYAPDRWRAALERVWLESSVDHTIDREPELASFRGEAHDRVCDEFAALEARLFELNRERLCRKHAEDAVAALNADPEVEALLRRTSQKTRNIPPLRDLLSPALTALRPIWMMSPLSVSQFCGESVAIFDAVVFDEASQLLPEDCVPALLRAKQAIVVGDNRQLPPTTFFAAVEGEEAEEDVGGFESILDECAAFLPADYLRWHYRSLDERLIAFSNARFYDGRLTTFPAPAEAGAVRHVLVPDAVYVAGREQSNAEEVRVVVDLILEHARERPGESLGVVAFGVGHQQRIQMELDRRLDEAGEAPPFFAADAAEPFFVKNLETVQGDERDAIVLSVGYGKSADGRLSHNFGPLNHKGGERRLNVAVTRARKRLTLVSSFTHHDVDPSRSSALGVARLRDYLEYAATGGTVIGAAVETPMNGFEQDVHDSLTAAGASLVAQFGCSGYRIDLAVRHPEQPGRFVLAIECDGASYHSAPTARDRDRLRQSVLERLGWRFHRIWSTDWFRDKPGEVRRAMAAIDRAARGVLEAEVVPAAAEIEFVENGRGRKPRLPDADSIDDYTDAQLGAMVRWLRADGMLRTEAQELELMMEHLGFARRGPKIVDRITGALRRLTR